MSTTISDDLLPQAADAIAKGQHADPFSVLGLHGTPARFVARTFAPHADSAVLCDAAGNTVAEAKKIHHDGLFSVVLEGRDLFEHRWRYRVGRHEWVADDPYRFGTILGDLDIYLIAEGRHRRLYDVFGAHPRTLQGVEGVSFAVWAPNAARVSVVGDFNGWDGRRNVMRRRTEAGVWELFIPGLTRGLYYKFEVVGRGGHVLPLKTDPFAFACEVPPDTSSVIAGALEHSWNDQSWMASREGTNAKSAPISIYEVHLGSWRRQGDNEYLSYDQLADTLIPYVKELGFTHVELMPINEHPFSGSWGYQPIGLYAPTSRFGTPDGFARFIDRAHQEGIGVLIDWVPAHFPTDAHGLGRFDGTALYEHQDPREGYHQDWNTLIYNLGRNEVRNFLEANAAYWLEQFHIDGLRVDAVASMLYRDYSRDEGQWVPNQYGGRENLESIEFFKSLNSTISESATGAITAAEESTAFPKVSHPVGYGGLGFDYKWNMGWMHDTLEYMQQDPIHRRYHHHKMTFGLVYAFNENFILPLSHDEVVHGKQSLINKMPGDRWQAFANLRAYYAFMWTHPGKKLLFMGGEFAQPREWNFDQSLDWHVLEREDHRGVQALVRDLNRLYAGLPALHEQDCNPSGFSWIDFSDDISSIYVFARYAADGTPAVVVCNLTPVVRTDYRIGLPRAGAWREALNSDAGAYGGSNTGNASEIQAEERGYHGQPASAELTLPPLGVLILTPASATG